MALAFVNWPNSNWQDAVAAGRPDDLQKEWQECRSVISRFDSMLVDLRKYGFGLVSGLLTANGILGGIANLLPKPDKGTPGFTVPSSVIAVLVSITMVLIAVLFVIDRYYSVLKWAATDKAQSLERTLSLGCMTGEMVRWANEQWWPKYVVLFQYGSFIVVSAGLGVAIMGGKAWPWALSPDHLAADFMWAVALGLGVAAPLAIMGGEAWPWALSPDHLAADFMWAVALLSLGLIIGLFCCAKKEWDKLSPGLSNVVPGVTTVRVTLTQPQPVKVHECQEVVVDHQIPPDNKVLAIVNPTDQDGLSIVGCRVTKPQRLVITFWNDGSHEITPTSDNYTVFVYA